jgi:hypothetical protein
MWFAFLKVKVRGWVKRSSEDMAQEVPHAGPTLSVTGPNNAAGKRLHLTRSAVTGSNDAEGKRAHFARSTALGPHPSARSHTSCRHFLGSDNKHHPKFTPRNSLTLRNPRHLMLAMSDQPLDQPKVASYLINPNKQYGVVKSDGNRCTTRLNCKTHGEAEKRAVPRPKPYQKLLTKQHGFFALDVRPSAHLTGQPRLAQIFDADVHCGADLPTGEPCTQDLLLCETHTYEQQSAVQGRSVGFDDLLRVNRANAFRPRWKSGDDPNQYNADTDCGAINSIGQRCQKVLSCNRHKMKSKRSAPRNPPFQSDLETLLQIQLSRTALYGIDEPWRRDATEKGQDDLKYHFLGGSGESQHTSGGEGGTGDDKIDAQGDSDDAPPATPSQPPRGRVDTTSPDHTPTAPSPKTPRGNASSLSSDTSDGEQFTPTSSKDSLHGNSSDEKHGDTVEASQADLDAQEAQLERAWAQLHQDQARQERHKAQLHDEEVKTCRDWEKLCGVQARQHRLEMQLLQDEIRQQRQKAQLLNDQHEEHSRAA